ncbi:hypothetical protein [Stenoxybacter acetivorans]|uniref:hypothetical protein n=1 Tax=Stenoxybacter acetivorans TaxID=422441 RepID=UPI00056A487D|nr:hypothetical protein [Stenoxybacter acetivorans]
MNNLNNAYINALLADAAYVANLTTLSGGALAKQLAKRMTEPVANFIANNFEVIDQFDESETGDYSGFDVTVWRGKSGTDYAGKVYLSFRGTEPGSTADYKADADLAVNIAARHQIMDMINWYLRAITPIDQMAKQFICELENDAGNSVTFDKSVSGTGTLLDVDAVQINGHSLGGHLAAAFARIFGGSVSIDGIDTYNSAGFLKERSKQFFKELEEILQLGTTSFNQSQNNCYTVNGISITTNDWYHNQIGERQEIFNKQAA